MEDASPFWPTAPLTPRDAAVITTATMDDDALLRDALAFIGDLELGGEDEDDVPFGLGALGITSDEPVSATFPSLEASFEPGLIGAPTPPVSEAPSSLHWPAKSAAAAMAPRPRTKRRDEVLYLRELVGDLETRLNGLRKHVGGQQQAAQRAKSAGAAQSTALVMSAWENIVSRQVDQRQRAEDENKKLKRMLEDQIQVGKSLERLLLWKRPSGPALETGGAHPEKRGRHGSLAQSWDKSRIFDELVDTVLNEYRTTDRAMAKLAGVLDSPNQREIRLAHDPELGIVLQTTLSQILPFSYEETAQEMWNGMPQMSTEQTPRGPFNVDVTSELIKSRYHTAANVGRFEGDVEIYLVGRRFIEAERTVITTSAFFDPVELSDLNMDGVYMRHRGWHVIEPVVVNGCSTKAATRMTAYAVAIPEAFGDVEDQSHKVGTLTNFLMSAIAVEIESRHQNLENRLFERSLVAGAHGSPGGVQVGLSR